MKQQRMLARLALARGLAFDRSVIFCEVQIMLARTLSVALLAPLKDRSRKIRALRLGARSNLIAPT